jgi:hypothetical protein
MLKIEATRVVFSAFNPKSRNKSQKFETNIIHKIHRNLRESKEIEIRKNRKSVIPWLKRAR